MNNVNNIFYAYTRQQAPVLQRDMFSILNRIERFNNSCISIFGTRKDKIRRLTQESCYLGMQTARMIRCMERAIEEQRKLEQKRAVSKGISDVASGVAAEGVPVFGRTAPVQNLIDDEEYLPAMNIFSQLALYAPEEIREIREAIKQFRTGNPPFKFNPNATQHPFSYFRGTFLNPIINPFDERCKIKDKNLAYKLCNYDKSLWETKFGLFVRKRLDIKEEYIKTDIKDIFYTPKNDLRVYTRQITCKSWFGNFVARTMLRLPVIGLWISGALELSHAAHEVNKGGNPFEEVGQAAVRFAGTNVLTGLFGAIGSMFGPIGSVIGASLGAMTSAAWSKIFD